jgi:hypothetical protein
MSNPQRQRLRDTAKEYEEQVCPPSLEPPIVRSRRATDIESTNAGEAASQAEAQRR